MKLNVNDVNLYIDIEGSGLVARGNQMVEMPLLITLHGSYLDHSYFKPDLEPLLEICQIMHLDYRGFGRSDLSEQKYWNFDQFADDVVSAMDILGIEKAILLGHSLGCHIGTNLTLRYADRVSSNIFINPAFLDLDIFFQNVLARAGIEAELAARKVWLESDLDALNDYVDLVVPHLFYGERPFDKETRGLTSFDFSLHTFDEVIETNLLQQLRKVQVPTLLCNGLLDIYMPPGLPDKLAEEINNPKIKVENFPEGAHCLLDDQTQKIMSSIRNFLNNL